MSESDLRADIQAHLATIAVLQDRERVWQGELEREVAKREAAENAAVRAEAERDATEMVLRDRLEAAEKERDEARSELAALPKGDLLALGERLAELLDADQWNGVAPHLEGARLQITTAEAKLEAVEEAVERFRAMAFLPHGTDPASIVEHYEYELRVSGYPEYKGRALATAAAKGERLSAAEAERDRLQQTLDASDNYKAFCDLTTERDRLREALEKYGRHSFSCNLGEGFKGYPDLEKVCDCGLVEALSGRDTV